MSVIATYIKRIIEPNKKIIQLIKFGVIFLYFVAFIATVYHFTQARANDILDA